MNVLVVAAHPDDEVLGMGGTMLKHALKNDKVYVIYLTSGIISRRSVNFKNMLKYDLDKNEQKKIEKQIDELKKDAKNACKILKVHKQKFYDFPDNEMDSVPLLKIVKAIEKEIYEVKPFRVYTNNYGDLNIDHKIVFNATLTACRPFRSHVKELMCFEVPSSTEWNYPIDFSPNYFVNIAAYLEKKVKALSMYKNEKRSFPHPRSSENIRINAKKWGIVSGINAAEAFKIIRIIEHN
ncbi:MAG: PIG-L deacetylase family protein [Nitrososphaerota archaeon]